MALLMTLFLALINLLISVATNSPTVSLTMLSAWIIACIFFVYFALLEYGCILCFKYFTEKRDNSEGCVKTQKNQGQTKDNQRVGWKKQNNQGQISDNQKAGWKSKKSGTDLYQLSLFLFIPRFRKLDVGNNGYLQRQVHLISKIVATPGEYYPKWLCLHLKSINVEHLSIVSSNRSSCG